MALPSHWYYNTETGALTQASGLAGLANVLGYEITQVGTGSGWKELNIPGGDTEAQAAAAAVEEYPTGKTPTTSVAQAAENDSGPIGAAAAATTSVASFLGSLEQSGTWVRVLKVALGGVLVIVGLARLSGAGKVIEEAVKP